jgi:glycerol uptake facilitator protein
VGFNLLTAEAFASELFGTAILMLIGTGVSANMVLPRTKGHKGGMLAATFGWGFAVFTGVFVAFRSGAHLNPAVTIGLLVAREPFNTDAAFPNIAPTITNAAIYIIAQLIGAFIGATLAWLVYRHHYDLATNPDKILGTFSTIPTIRNPLQNFIVETIATFVLVFWVLVSGPTPEALGPLAVALVVVGIGLGLGGPTGWAINPARDLGARFAHAVVPIPRKGGSDWSYAWIPVVAPIVGSILAGVVGHIWVR